MKTKAQVEKQIENLLQAQAMMEDLPNSALVAGLFCWRANKRKDFDQYDEEIDDKQLLHRCGSAACFGGWVAVHPYFRKLGVRPGKSGEPAMEGMLVWDVAHDLFGDSNMFDANCGGGNGNDRAVVLQRIKNALADRLEELETAV